MYHEFVLDDIEKNKFRSDTFVFVLHAEIYIYHFTAPGSEGGGKSFLTIQRNNIKKGKGKKRGKGEKKVIKG